MHRKEHIQIWAGVILRGMFWCGALVSVTLTSPNLPSPLLSFKEACPDTSPSLLGLFNPLQRHLLLTQWPQRVTWPPGVKGQATSHTPIGYKAVDMTTRHLPASGPGRHSSAPRSSVFLVQAAAAAAAAAAMAERGPRAAALSHRTT